MKNFDLNCKYTSPDGKITATNVQFMSDDMFKTIRYIEDFLITCGYNIHPGSLQLTNNKPYKEIDAK